MTENIFPEYDPSKDDEFFDNSVDFEFPQEYVNMVNTHEDLLEYYEKTDLPEKHFTEEMVNGVRPIDLEADPEKYVSQEERDRRLDICNGCERLYKPARACLECACFVGIYTWNEWPQCPLKKW